MGRPAARDSENRSGRHRGFGENSDGQLGDETDVDKPVPVRVEHLNGVKAITAGEYTGLALKRDGSVRAWGDNEYGQLGDDSTDNRYLPVKVRNLSNVRQVAAGTDSSYAVKE